MEKSKEHIDEIKCLQQRIQELESSMRAYGKTSLKEKDFLKSSFNYIQAIIDNMEDPIIVIKPDYKIAYTNKKAREMTDGADPVELGLTCHEVSHHSKTPCMGKDDPCPLRIILKTKSPTTMIHIHYDSEGNKKHVEIAASPILDNSGNVTHIIEACRNISYRKKMEGALRESEARYRSLFEQSIDAIFLIEAEGPGAGRILSANKAACKLHGYTPEEISKLNIRNLLTEVDASKVPERLERLLNGEKLTFEIMHRKKDGTIFPVDVSASLLLDGERKIILAVDRDVSVRKEAEMERLKLIEKLKHRSRTDGLTGILNRQYLDIRLNEEIRRAKRYGNPLSLIMLDIDNFKPINDTYGHLVGDKILITVSDIIKETIRDIDIAGRFGGDEFMIILPQTPIDVGTRVAERIRSKIEQFKIPLKKGGFISFTVSLGICQYHSKFKDMREFIANADKAMYSAKQNGLNRVCKAVV